MRETHNTELSDFFARREGWIVSFLLGLAFAVRLYLVFHTYLITHDGILYIKISKLISQGEVGAAFNLSFLNLYPLMTIPFQQIFKEWELSAQMVSTVFGSLTIIPFYLLIRSIFGRTVALISSFFFVFHPYLARLSAEVVRGPAFWFFFMMTLWVGWEAISRKGVWLSIFTSFLATVSFFLRPEGILVIPFIAVWILLEDWRGFKSTWKQRVWLTLCLLVTVPILLLLPALFLKIQTGQWHWARADTIIEIAPADVTMRHVKKNLPKLEMQAWDDSPKGRVDFIRLRQFLSLATEHRIGVVMLELVSKFQKAMHPLLLILLLFGVIKRKNIPYRKREEIFLLSVLALFLLVLLRYGTVTFYIGTRHMMVPVILCLAWAGAGVIEVEYRIRSSSLGPRLKDRSFSPIRYLRWTLVVAIVVAMLPKTLASQRMDKIPIREAGVWIKEHGPKNPVVMGQGELARIGFYGDGTFQEIPRNEDLYESLKRGKVDFLAINEKNIEDTHPGLIDSLDSERFEKEVVLGMPSGQYVIIIYSVRS